MLCVLMVSSVHVARLPCHTLFVGNHADVKQEVRAPNLRAIDLAIRQATGGYGPILHLHLIRTSLTRCVRGVYVYMCWCVCVLSPGVPP